MIGQTKFKVRPDDAVAARLSLGFESIVDEFEVREDFPAEVLASADAAAAPSAVQARVADSTRADLTALEFVTLDPASSTDLDQAFCLESGADGVLVLHYAIADVGAFVPHTPLSKPRPGSVVKPPTHRTDACRCTHPCCAKALRRCCLASQNRQL